MEDKSMAEQQVREKTIPVFTVLKNGAILKNIFVVNSRDFSSPEKNGKNAVSDDLEVEEILLVGRHPDCDILLTHPSISRYHLQIRSLPSRQKLFVTDLSSVHGTWVTNQKVEPDACVEVNEGDVIRIGGSTRIYRLHWIPLSRAYDVDNPFVSPLDASTLMDPEEENRILEAENLEVAHQPQADTASGDDGNGHLNVTSEGSGSSVPTLMDPEEENRILEAENLEVAHQPQADTASGDDGNGHLDVTSEGSGSSVPSEDEDTYIMIKEISLPRASPSVLTLAGHSVNTQNLLANEDLQTSSKWDLDVVETAAEKPSIGCGSSNQLSGSYPEVLGCCELAVADEWDVRQDDGLLLDVMSEMMESPVHIEEDPHLAAKETSSLLFPRDSIETENLQITEDVQASREMTVNIIEANAENPSSGSLTMAQIDGCFEASGCNAFELAAEAETLRICQEVSGETEFVTEQVMQAFAKLLTKAEIQGHVDNGEIEVSRQVIAVSPSSSPQAERLEEILTEDARGLLGSEYRSKVSIENLHEIGNEVNPAEDQNENQGMNRESEEIFDDGSSSCHSKDLEQSGTQSFLSLANLKTKTEMSFGFESSEGSYNLSELWGEVNTDKEVPFPSTLAAETFENTIEKLPYYYSESQENQTEQPHAVRYDAMSQMDSSRRGKAASVSLLEASGCSAFELAAEVEILGLRQEVSEDIGFVTEKALEASAEPLTKTYIQSHGENGESEVLMQVIAVSWDSFPQTEPTLSEDARGLLGSEVGIETDSENLHKNSNGETKISSSQASAASNCLFVGNERLSRINTDDIQSLCSSWQALPKSEIEAPSEMLIEVNFAGDQNKTSAVNIQSLCSSWQALPKSEIEAPSEMLIEVNFAGDQNKTSAVNRETGQTFDNGSSSCHSEDLEQSEIRSVLLTPTQKPKTELSVSSRRSEETYSLSEIVGEGNTDTEVPFPTLAAEIFEDTKPTDELPPDYTGGQENQTPRTVAVRDDVRLSTSNIWSRRRKAASVLQVRTNKSEGKQKQIGKQPRAQLQKKQALSDLTVDHGAEKLEPEIFTPDKENMTPSSHMLKRLQDVGDIEDSKSSSKLSGRLCSSKIPSNIASAALTEPEIFTPDKENLTPNSHMLRRLQEVGEIKDTKGSSSKAMRKPFFDIHVEENLMAEQKPVAPKKKAERAPFQPLLEKSSSQSQPYTEISSTASVRNNISRGIRSSSNLSDGKKKMKWTIVLDTSSLLDKESRKPLHLLQGLKGTHLVVPRTVLRELKEAKRTRSLLFRRRAEVASSALDWIEECKINTKWWIQVQSPSEETKATAPTPPVTPQSNGSAFSFSLHWNSYESEIDSPTTEDQVLECALVYRNRNTDEKLVLLSNDVTLMIKAMAEGVICETPHEFYESLKNPFSERFMWPESLPRGRTWSHADDVVLRESHNNRPCFPYRKKPTFSGAAGGAKGLKLVLLHNSHYAHIH